MTKAGRRGGGTTPKVSLNERLLLIASAQQQRRTGGFLSFISFFQPRMKREKREETREERRVLWPMRLLLTPLHSAAFPGDKSKRKEKAKSGAAEIRARQGATLLRERRR